MDFEYFVNVKETAFRDSSGVYLDGQKIAISNTNRGGYVRYADGFLNFSAIDTCNGVYNLSTPKVFVGTAPNCTEDDVYCNVISTAECNDFVTSVTFDKKRIAESEGIDIEELTKFDNVLLVKIEYTTTQTAIYDPDCELC